MEKYKNKKKIYSFWKQRISNNPNLVCTNDIFVDEFESNKMIEEILPNKNILEIGCGNGLLVKKLLKKKKIKNYTGIDFVDEFIDYANKFIKKNNKDLNFYKQDLTSINKNSFSIKFDYIISKRAIQNVLSHKLQMRILDNLGLHIKRNGKIILMESSYNAQKNINIYRKKLKLEKIKPPFHNLFLNDTKIENFKFKNIKFLGTNNFASSYYFVTRIIYASYIRRKQGVLKTSKYFNEIGSSLDNSIFKEDFSQIKIYYFKKK